MTAEEPKIVWMLSVSLDGYMEGPNRELDWQTVDDELHRHFNQELAKAAAFWDGRVTYELMVDYWPSADEDPASPAPVVEFARIWRDMPKVVYSTTLERAEWNTSIERKVDPVEVAERKQQATGDIFLGGADLGAEFMRLGLIDEYRIYVHPVVLGKGTPMFPPSDAALKLRLTDIRTFDSGVVLLRYGTA